MAQLKTNSTVGGNTIASQDWVETKLTAPGEIGGTTPAAGNFTTLDLTDDTNHADNAVIRPKLQDYSETVNALGTLTGGTDDIDLEDGNVVTATISTAAQTFTFSNPSASGTACSFTFWVTNGGSQTITWPASVDWPGGTAPTLTTSGTDVLVFTTYDAGTTWFGAVVQRDLS